MNATRLKISLFIALAIGALGVSSCCKQTTVHYYLPANAYSYLPYDSTSSFSMMDSAGTVLHYTLSRLFREDMDYGCFECCEDVYGEEYTLSFACDSSALALKVSLMQGIDNAQGPTPPLLSLAVGNRVSSSIPVDADPCTAQAVPCLDSMALQGQVYRDVYEITVPGSGSGAAVKTIWYNATQGFLKFQYFNGAYWELIP